MSPHKQQLVFRSSTRKTCAHHKEFILLIITVVGFINLAAPPCRTAPLRDRAGVRAGSSESADRGVRHAIRASDSRQCLACIAAYVISAGSRSTRANGKYGSAKASSEVGLAEIGAARNSACNDLVLATTVFPAIARSRDFHRPPTRSVFFWTVSETSTSALRR